jgi:Ca-activated chloride channel family protein
MRVLALAAALAFLLAALAGGAAPFGRVMMALGLPGLAAPLFDDPAWRGVAAYRAGNFDAAAGAFAEAGEPFNLGNAEAHAGRLAAALEAYDIAIARGDAVAQANFDVVAALYASLAIDPEALALFARREDGPVAESHIAEGNARAAGSGSEVTNSNTMLGLAEVDSRGRLGVRRVFDDSFMVADERWLENLQDVPGAFMQARIQHEQKRRAALGLAPPVPEDPM